MYIIEPGSVLVAAHLQSYLACTAMYLLLLDEIKSALELIHCFWQTLVEVSAIGSWGIELSSIFHMDHAQLKS